MSKRRPKKLFYSFVFIIAFAIVGWLAFYVPANKAAAPGNQSQSPSQTSPSAPAVATFDKQQNSISKAGSLWWIVSKVRPVQPSTYAPDDLTVPKIPLRNSGGGGEMQVRKDAAAALEKLVTGGQADKINLMLASGYRSYELQVSVYNANVQKYGQAGADKQSARPGTSEHQTGLAADLEPTSKQCEVEQCFGDLPEGKWLATNAYKYGFIIRYPLNKDAVTGYEYEPWHVRYVGTDLAAEMHKQNILTLEEFFGVVPDKQPY